MTRIQLVTIVWDKLRFVTRESTVLITQTHSCRFYLSLMLWINGSACSVQRVCVCMWDEFSGMMITSILSWSTVEVEICRDSFSNEGFCRKMLPNCFCNSSVAMLHYQLRRCLSVAKSLSLLSCFCVHMGENDYLTNWQLAS